MLPYIVASVQAVGAVVASHEKWAMPPAGRANGAIDAHGVRG